MTENEAIERIRTGICCEKGTARYCTDACMYGEEKCAYSVATKALEEIQQYRAIGTVEECREAIENRSQRAVYDVDAVVEQLEDYSDADEADAHGTIPVIELDRAIEIVKGGGVDA